MLIAFSCPIFWMVMLLYWLCTVFSFTNLIHGSYILEQKKEKESMSSQYTCCLVGLLMLIEISLIFLTSYNWEIVCWFVTQVLNFWHDLALIFNTCLPYWEILFLVLVFFNIFFHFMGSYVSLQPSVDYYKHAILLIIRTFTQVSVQWQDTDSMREELDDLQVRVLLSLFLWFSEVFVKSWVLILFSSSYNTTVLCILTDLSEHEVGNFVEFACWDVQGQQVSFMSIFSCLYWHTHLLKLIDIAKVTASYA